MSVFHASGSHASYISQASTALRCLEKVWQRRSPHACFGGDAWYGNLLSLLAAELLVNISLLTNNEIEDEEY